MWLQQFLHFNSKDPELRLQAVKRLAEDADRKNVPALKQALRDRVPEIAMAAAVGLGKIPTASALKCLVAATRSEFAHIRQAAIEGLKSFQEESVQGILVGLLSDFDPGVRGRAALVLERRQWKPQDVKEAVWFEIARGRLAQAASHGAAAVHALEQILNGAPFNLQVSVIRALGTIPDERVLNSLLAALGSTDYSVCIAAVDALGNFGGAQAIDALLPLLKHKDHRVRVAVIEALAQLDAQAIAPRIAESLGDSMWDVRCAAAVALGKLRCSEGVRALIDALRDPDNDVREASAVALGRIRDRQAVGPLVLAMVDPDSSVRRAATTALVAVEPGWQRSDAARQKTADLRRALESADTGVRFAANNILDQLGAAGTPIRGFETSMILTTAVQKQNRVLTVFIELLADRDADVRLVAAKTLGRLGDPRAIEALRGRLSDEDEMSRKAAIEALALLGDGA